MLVVFNSSNAMQLNSDLLAQLADKVQVNSRLNSSSNQNPGRYTPLDIAMSYGNILGAEPKHHNGSSLLHLSEADKAEITIKSHNAPPLSYPRLNSYQMRQCSITTYEIMARSPNDNKEKRLGTAWLGVKTYKKTNQQDPYATLINIHVNKDFRGLEIGSKIITTCKNQARQLGLKHIQIDAYPYSFAFEQKYVPQVVFDHEKKVFSIKEGYLNELRRLVRFYQKNGAKIDGTYEDLTSTNCNSQAEALEQRNQLLGENSVELKYGELFLLGDENQLGAPFIRMRIDLE